MPKVQIRGPVAWYSNFPDIFYVICAWDNEGMDFKTIDATIEEAVAQEQVMAHTFDEAYEDAMRELHSRGTLEAGQTMAQVIYQVRLDCPRYFYKKVDLTK